MRYISVLPFLIMSLNSYSMAQTATNKVANKEATKSSRWELRWKSSLSANSTSGEKGEAKLFGFDFSLNSHFSITENLALKVRPSFKYSNGASQSFDTADKSLNALSISHAGVDFKMNSHVVTQAGALSQDKIHSGLLTDSSAFPSVRGILKTDSTDEESAAALILQTAVPTTSSLATNTGEKEKTPSMNYAAIKGRVPLGEALEVKVQVGAFQWENLPTTVAQRSYALGNSVNSISDSEGQWLYKYNGYDSKLDLELELEDWTIIGTAAYLKNTSAPKTKSDAYSLIGGIAYQFNPTLHSHFSAGQFRIESDATVAYFSPGSFYNTNRNGYLLEAKLAFPKDGYNLAVKYVEADAIVQHPIQTRERNLMLRLETTYASF